MSYFSSLLDAHVARVQEIVAISDINEELVKIAVSNLQHLKNDLEATGRNAGILNKVNVQLNVYEQVAQLPELESKYPVLRGQMVVLIIGAQEALIGDVFVAVVENNPEKIIWSDDKEKISFDPSLLSSGFSLGDAMISHLKNKSYSFQDLGSAIQAINKYLLPDFKVDDEIKDELILASAWRNIIVHNRSIIDPSFIKQIRTTKYSKNYCSGDELNITQVDVETLSSVTINFAANLLSELEATLQ